MQIKSQNNIIEIINDQQYTPGSADNIRSYPTEVDVTGGGGVPYSRHGVIINGHPVAIFMAYGGASVVHEHSAILLEGSLYLAVGDHVVCFEVGSQRVRWFVPIDSATCFGVHYNKMRDALVSHGELEITRFNRDGQILWSSSGADIFTEGFYFKEGWVEAVDFNQMVYRFDYDTGKLIRT